MHRHYCRPVPRLRWNVSYISAVKKCSWGWANLSPETCRAELKRLIYEKFVASCWLFTSFVFHLYEEAFSQIKMSKLPDRWSFNKLPSLVPKLWTLFQFSYRKICTVMHQLHSKNVYGKHLLIMVNCCVLKGSLLRRVLKIAKSDC